MTIAIVGTPALGNTGVVFATSIAAPATSHTTGNALVVTAHCEDLSVTIDSVTDTAGNKYLPIFPTRENQSQLMFQRQFICLSIIGNAANVVTANFSGSVDFRGIEVIELSFTGRLEFDASSFDDRATGATSSTFSVSPTAAATGSSIVVAAGSSWNPSVITNTVGGFTAQAKGDNSLQVFTKIGSAQVGFPATFTYAACETLFQWVCIREIAAPVILVPPSTTPVQVGDSFRLGVLAVPASGALTYQWQDNSGGSLANIAGETQQYLDVSTVTIGFNARQYRVLVSDSVGTTTSATFVLGVSDRADANYFLRDVPSDASAYDVRLYVRPDAVLGLHTTVAADTITFSDSAVAILTHVTVAADTITFSDSAVAIMTLVTVASDTVSFSDSAVAGRVRPAVAADTVAFSDSATAIRSRVTVAADTVTFSDSAVAILTHVTVASDTNTFSDSAVAILTHVTVATDTVTFSDSAVAIMTLVTVASDTVSFSDSAVAGRVRPAVAADTVSFSDSAVASRGAGIHTAVASDSITFTDSAVAVSSAVKGAVIVPGGGGGRIQHRITRGLPDSRRDERAAQFIANQNRWVMEVVAALVTSEVLA